MNTIFSLSLGLICAFFLTSCGNGAAEVENSTRSMSIKSEGTKEKLMDEKHYAIVIHGGAGSIKPDKFTEEKEDTYTKALDTALQIGEKGLENGKAALDVVLDVITYLEDNPLFNSGKGAVLTAEGEAELDASLMDGSTLNAGAVAGVRTIKNPILGAKLVMDETPHVMLASEGADVFAKNAGLEIVGNSYFITDKRRAKYEEKLDKHGTVGCVVLDREGNLAAGTSTGGMSNKKWGRIGDSPIIGAGTYADNRTCAVSCTGHGEYFIRKSAAHDIHAQILHADKSLEVACDETLESIKELGGSGGLIAVDKNGNVALPFNTNGMFRAYKTKDERVIAMFK
jgi:beta-aspartyl-peptidase (threonine type)